MIVPLLLSAAVAATPPPPKAAENTCTPRESCRFVPSYTLRSPKGDFLVKADEWVAFMDDDRLVLRPGETLVLKLDGPPGKLRPVIVQAGRAEDLLKDHRDAATEQAMLAQNAGDREVVNQVVMEGGVAAVRAEKDTVRSSSSRPPARRT